MKQAMKKGMAALLCALLALGLSAPSLAAAPGTQDTAATDCTNHQIHTAACGYVPVGSEGSPSSANGEVSSFPVNSEQAVGGSGSPESGPLPGAPADTISETPDGESVATPTNLEGEDEPDPVEHAEPRGKYGCVFKHWHDGCHTNNYA